MRRGARAFTLIELMVVLVIIAVLSALIVPGFAGSRVKAELREAGRQLWTTARFAQQHAVLLGVECRLVLLESSGADGPGFRVEVAVDDAANAEGFATLRAGPIRGVSFPPGVSFGEILIDGEARTAGGSRVIRFLPTGQSDAACVQVTDGLGTWSVAVFPNSGRCELLNRAVSNLPNAREDLDA